jgi:hypothetical protein
MKTSVIAVALVSLTACSTIKSLTGVNPRSIEVQRAEEQARWDAANAVDEREMLAREEQSAKNAEERRRAEAAKEACFRQGARQLEVKTAWGSPDFVEFKNGTTYWRYENGGYPVYFGFKSEKVNEWFFDHSEAADRRRIAQDEINSTKEQKQLLEISRKQHQMDVDQAEANLRNRLDTTRQQIQLNNLQNSR